MSAADSRSRPPRRYQVRRPDTDTPVADVVVEGVRPGLAQDDVQVLVSTEDGGVHVFARSLATDTAIVVHVTPHAVGRAV